MGGSDGHLDGGRAADDRLALGHCKGGDAEGHLDTGQPDQGLAQPLYRPGTVVQPPGPSTDHHSQQDHNRGQADVDDQQGRQMSLQSAEHQLDDQGGDQPLLKCAVVLGVRPQFGRGSIEPQTARDNRNRNHDAEEDLTENPVKHGQGDARRHVGFRGRQGEATGDPEPTEYALQDDQDDRHQANPVQPFALVGPPQPEGEDDRGQSDKRPKQPVRVLVVDAAGHSRQRVEKHIGTEGVGPVDHCQTGLVAGHQPARDQQQEGGCDGDLREQGGPVGGVAGPLGPS